MKKETKISQAVLVVALATVLILLIPFIAMQFTSEVNWSATDFIIMGTLLFSAGLSFVLISRYAPGFIYRAAVGAAVGTTLLMIWANLAVGLIGGGPNPGNLMYLGVLAVVITGTILSRLTPAGMERAMFASAITLVLVAAIAILANMDEYPGSSVMEIIGVNAFFAILFAASGLLFRYATPKQSASD